MGEDLYTVVDFGPGEQPLMLVIVVLSMHGCCHSYTVVDFGPGEQPLPVNGCCHAWLPCMCNVHAPPGLAWTLHARQLRRQPSRYSLSHPFASR